MPSQLSQSRPRRSRFERDNVLFTLFVILYLAALFRMITSLDSGLTTQENNFENSTLTNNQIRDAASAEDSSVSESPEDENRNDDGIEKGPSDAKITAARKIYTNEEWPSDASTTTTGESLQIETVLSDANGNTAAVEKGQQKENALIDANVTTTQKPSPVPVAEAAGSSHNDPPGFGSNSAVNMVLVYENRKILSDVNAALERIATEFPDSAPLSLKIVSRLYIDPSETPIRVVTKLCEVVDALLASGDTRPDVVLDLTEKGVPSEAVKVVMKSLKIPTVSTSLGQDADVREWRGLTKQEENYLVRISPPTDMAHQLIRSLVQLQNISDAVILFYESFDLYSKYKSLLRDLPTRHKLVLLGKGWNSKKNFKKNLNSAMFDLRFSNFFVLASPTNITKFFRSVAKMSGKVGKSLRNKHFSWYAVSLEPGKIDCQKLSNNNTDISFVYASPTQTQSSNEKNLIISRPNFENQFFYNITIDTFMAVRNLKLGGKWPLKNFGKLRCATFTGKEAESAPNLNIDLLSFFKQNQNENSNPGAGTGPLGTYHMIRNGLHHSEFDLSIQRLTLEKGMNTSCTEESLGVWTSGFGGKDLVRLDSEKDIGFHLAKKVYRIVTVENPPFVYWKEDCKDQQVQGMGGKHCFYGYSIDILDRLAEVMNFTYNIYSVDGFGYLDKPPKGWDGAVRELMHKRADIAIGSMTVMPEREEVVDFASRSYYPPVGFTFAMRKIKVPSTVWSFLAVLESDVWWCILGTYFFTTLLLVAFDKWSPSSYQNTKDSYQGYGDEIPRTFDVKESLWFCFCSMTPQGGGEAPLGLAGRLVASTWWLFSFVIIASYTANMAAFLTISRLVKPIRNMQDLTNQYRVQYSVVNMSSAYIYYDRLTTVEQIFYERWRDMSLDDNLDDYNRSLMAVWTYPISDKHTKLWQTFVETKMPDTIADAVTRIKQINSSGLTDERQGRFAIIGEETDLKYLTLTECQIKIVGPPWSSRSYGVAVQKGSPLKQLLDTALDRMAAMREIEYYYNKWWTVGSNPHLKSCPRHYYIEDGIDFHNLSGIWVVTICGVICGVIWIVVETIYYFWINRVKTVKTKDPMESSEDNISTISHQLDGQITENPGPPVDSHGRGGVKTAKQKPKSSQITLVRERLEKKEDPREATNYQTDYKAKEKHWKRREERRKFDKSEAKSNLELKS